MYEQHDNPELAGKSDLYIHEHPAVAFPYDGNERTTNKSLVAIVGSV
jgi:hypothetical protein